MPRGDKSKYTAKQDRKADHIAEGYEASGVSHKEAERRAWATVNKESGGGKKSGSGRGKKESHAASRKGGRIGGRASASRSRGARARHRRARRQRRASAAPREQPSAHHAASAWFDISLMAAIWLRRPILRAHSGQ